MSILSGSAALLFASDEKLVASDENKNRDPTKFTHHFPTI
jgi:hypothetical protein